MLSQHALCRKKGISEVNASSVENVGLEGGGGQVASYGGLFVLGGFADSLGLGDELSAAVGHSGERPSFRMFDHEALDAARHPVEQCDARVLKAQLVCAQQPDKALGPRRLGEDQRFPDRRGRCRGCAVLDRRGLAPERGPPSVP